MQVIPIEQIVKIQPKGLITIPKKFRRDLGLEENSLARVKKERGRLIIEPVRTLPYPVRTYTDQELEEFVAFDKEQTEELRREGLLK